MSALERKRYNFERYVLDVGRGSLLCEGVEIVLRPKTFAVLQFLVENSGRLVSKDELFAAVWPDVTVTDDVLVQSIGELRRSLGEDGASLIKTVPRRGYRFEAAAAATAADPPRPDIQDTVSPGIKQELRIAPVDGPSSHLEVLAVEPVEPQFHDQAGRGNSEPTAQAIPSDTSTSTRSGLRQATWLWISRIVNQLQLVGEVVRSAASAGPRAFAATCAIILSAAILWSIMPSRSSRVAATSGIAAPRSEDMQSATRPMIAVMPFATPPGEPSDAYFADGMTQDVISALGRFSGLTVMSWNAVAELKGKGASPTEVAQRLRVQYQIEGSVRRAGDRIRVTTQLVAPDGRVFWSERYDEALRDLFSLQDKMTAEIAGTLAIKITQFEQRRVLAKKTANLAAYELVLRARPALQRPTRGAIVEARASLRRAIELDPIYAEAYSALAETYHIDIAWGWAQSPSANLDRAANLATKALQLNDHDQRARILIGRIHIFHNRYEQAQEELNRAVAANPSSAEGLAGQGHILMWLGQTDAAIAALELAQRIDPDLNAVDRFALSMAYYQKGRYDSAVAQAELNLRNSRESSFSWVVLSAALAEQGRLSEAARAVASLRRHYPAFDPLQFGNKFRNPADLARLRDGLSKAGFEGATAH